MGFLSNPTKVDQEMRLHLKAAVKALQKALAIAYGQQKVADPQAKHRAKNVARQLRSALGLLEGIGTLSPGWDMDDPDLIPEGQKRARLSKPSMPLRPPMEGDE